MDASRFDALTRRFTASRARRDLLCGFGILGLATALARLPWADAAAKKKRKKKRRKRRKRRKKPKKNQFGCIDVGRKCYGKDAQCCSGLCEGKKKKSKCVAHNAATCAAADNSCPESVPCGVGGECYQTTGKAGFCAAQGTCDCHPCTKDIDCEAEFGRGAACIVCTSDCINVNGSAQGTACVPPAPLEI